MQYEEPQYALQRLQRLLSALGMAITAAVVLLWGWTLLWPLLLQEREALARTETLQALLRDAAHIRSQHACLHRQLDEAQEKEAALKSRIPDEPREAEFLAQVSRAAGDVGLNISQYRPGPITSAASYSTMRVDLTCEGTYPSICRFLDRLQKLPRYSAVIRFGVDSSDMHDKYCAKMCLELYVAGGNAVSPSRKG